ncbi:MAG TPA: DUF4262 domain-containing protein [Pseudosphingobacterium sp.]|nr:DUF4262 domain-containing protein [Pseudosphingobacterium sp.]
MENKKEHDCQIPGKLEKDISEHGWQVVMIPATSYLPPFAYTVGLWENYGHPELIGFGLPIGLFHLILNKAGELVKSGSTIQINKEYEDFLETYLTTFIPVDPRNLKDYFGAAIEHYQTMDFAALQLIWPDKNQRFPWQDGFEEKYKRLQPLLDRNATFKFIEERNTAIFTTKQWLEEAAPIMEVVHDHEGDWQFITEEWEEEDIITVSLEEMIQKDDSLNELFNLDFGEGAVRESITSKWERYKTDGE